jgi:succinyl-CoA synthetase alpha subunit
MGILVGSTDRVIIQGMTGRTGRAAAARMDEDGTPLVAGVSPRRGGTMVQGRPIFETVGEAVASVAATASFISVPAPWTLDATLEAISAGIRTIVIYTEHVPVHDAMRIRAAARTAGCVVLGPNSAGCVTPGQANLSDLDSRNLRVGRVGVVSKSGTLAYEIVDGVVGAGEGLSSIVCLGGDPVIGSDHASILISFEKDAQTEAVIVVGEIGGTSEDRAADLISHMTTPVVALVVGHHAPPGKRMGHAGALLARESESAAAKSERLREAGATVVDAITDVGPAVVAQVRAR